MANEWGKEKSIIWKEKVCFPADLGVRLMGKV
jgi:hypothetical protein